MCYGCRISNEHLAHICKYGQGSSCCKYVVFFAAKQDFFCVKKSEHKQKIDDYADHMTAKGDNCEGLVCEEE